MADEKQAFDLEHFKWLWSSPAIGKMAQPPSQSELAVARAEYERCLRWLRAQPRPVTGGHLRTGE